MKFAAYDQIAGEYYDAFHKTCRNFDQTTVKALESVRSQIPPRGMILDIGAGKGRCVEFLGVDSNRIIQLDNSHPMLVLSPREQCLIRIQHEAEQLPFLDNEFSCVAAFLCDPFLGLDFLSEAYRVLSPGGIFLATTPAYDWSISLRRGIPIESSETRFKTLAGSEIRVPSVLVVRERLVEMLHRAGFVAGVQVQPHRLPEGAAPISEDVIKAAEVLKCDVRQLDLLHFVIASK